MTDSDKKALIAEMTYKKTLLEIENDKITKIMQELNDYFIDKFNKEDESYKDRQEFFYKVGYLKVHVDQSRARMEEINDIEVDLGNKEDEL